jgi:glycosyltransferase involved in cell wall biosynthesis
MKLSVCLITYNHERFVAQALESALAQETSFEFEIVIGEDCSTDRTRQILLDYQQRYPDKIRLLPPEQNLGSNRNFARTLQACRGQYIALLEGDDYWISPAKLEQQVSFLDSHEECAICFHAVRVFQEDGNEAPRISPRFGHKKISTIKDLLGLGNFIPTCAAVFRNGLINEFPEWFYRVRIADFSLHVFNAQHGKIGYIHKVMGVYRIHAGGTFSAANTSGNAREVVRTYDYLNSYLDYKYDRTIKAIRSYWLAVDYYRKGKLTRAQACAAKRLWVRPFNTQTVMACLLMYSPPLYRLARTFRPLA